MSQLVRPSGRPFDQMREIVLETEVTRYAEGSCLAKFGNTHVLCTASWENRVRRLDEGAGARLGDSGIRHAAARDAHPSAPRGRAGKQSGRTQEIQRLIGRSLRSVSDLASWARTRSRSTATCCRPTAAPGQPSITGGCVALVAGLQIPGR